MSDLLVMTVLRLLHKYKLPTNDTGRLYSKSKSVMQVGGAFAIVTEGVM